MGGALPFGPLNVTTDAFVFSEGLLDALLDSYIRLLALRAKVREEVRALRISMFRATNIRRE